MPLHNILYFSSKRFTLSLLLCLLSNHALAQKAPNFSLKSNQGTVELSRLQGRTVYIDFWAAWCKPCRKSFPFMNELHTRYAKQGLIIIAINLDDNPEQATKFLQQHPANFVIAYDDNGKTAKNYQLTSMPSSWLIGKNGDIISNHQGFKESDQDALENQIRAALTAPK
jgi:thiol-disulfide isomerase/thioredoxin